MPSESSRLRAHAPRSAGQLVAVVVWQMVPWAALCAGLAVCLVAFFSLIGSRSAELAEERRVAAQARVEEAVPVIAVSMTPTTLVDSIRLPGELKANESVTIAAEVAGNIVAVTPQAPFADNGQWVKKGTVLARIDDRDYRAALSEAAARLKLAELTLERSRKLAAGGALTQAELDRDVSSHQQVKAAHDLAALNLERCAIVAPFDGVINARHFALGTHSAVGAALYELIDIDPVKVRVAIPQADVHMVSALTEAEVMVDGIKTPFRGTKNYLSYTTHEMAKVYELELAIANPERILRPGMMVEAVVVRERKAGVLMVPLYAVLTNGQEQYCYVADGSAAKRKNVRVGRISGTAVEVLEGLTAGDRLIVKGQRQCADGAALAVTMAQGGAADMALSSGTILPGIVPVAKE